MPGIYYAAVEDDPLTSGEGSRVFAYEQVGTIQGEDGKRRRMAFTGDDAYCPKCNSTGVITYGVDLSDVRRLFDRANNRRQAVGGDMVLCKCVDHPRIIATYGRKWMIRDQGVPGTNSKSVARAPAVNHWISFALTDLGSHEGLQCIAYFADGSQQRGTFDANSAVRFERADNGNLCTHIELLSDNNGSDSSSVTESLLSAIKG
ncbi:hypothetical protein [Paraburkholderia sp. ZP32-5]|uniref:hypothetical protein n=1 Tax=Paraburkholderia sp. ZP32-5 TaxID=2883245 RepID=UPI001F19B068|nr:hypothetical protein [Paraburkholderia sp. ZP32-5]